MTKKAKNSDDLIVHGENAPITKAASPLFTDPDLSDDLIRRLANRGLMIVHKSDWDLYVTSYETNKMLGGLAMERWQKDTGFTHSFLHPHDLFKWLLDRHDYMKVRLPDPPSPSPNWKWVGRKLRRAPHP